MRKCVTSGVSAINSERSRQINKEQWTRRHDKAHDGCELAEAARCCLQSYVNGIGSYHPTSVDDEWGLGKKHNKNPKRLLIIAGALIAAEIDRLQYK